MPKFCASSIRQEIFTVVNEIVKGAYSVPAEIQLFPTLRRHLKEELRSAEVVYERIYPKSLQIRDKESLLLTQLLCIRKLPHFTSESSATSPAVDAELPPYYSLKNCRDKTLVFESRFECGNLCLALKVNPCIV